MSSYNSNTARPRLAVIGAGNWGMNHVKTLRKLGVLAAVAEADNLKRNELTAQYPDLKTYEDHSRLLTDTSIDGVVVATPAFTHCSVARDVLLSDKDVLIEKPMAMNIQEADELIALASYRKKILMVGHILLYSPVVRAIKKILRRGEIGPLIHIEMRRLKLGKIRREENVYWSFAPHDLAVMLHLVESEIDSVSAAGINAMQPLIADDVRSHFIFKNGVRAHIHASWLWPEIERKTVIVGKKGMIVYDEYNNEAHLLHKSVDSNLNIQDHGAEEIIYDKSAPLLELEDSHFIECIKNRNNPVTDGLSGRRVIEILMEVDKALAGEKVD